MAYKFIGDSHSHYSFCRVRPGRSCWLGPRTMHRFAGSWGDILEPVKKILRPADTLVFSFGEIDIRTHVIRIANEHRCSSDEVTADLAERFVRALRDIRDRFGAKVATVTVLPPIADLIQSPGLPSAGSSQERVVATRALNARLSELCRSTDIPLIDFYNECALADGTLNAQISDGSIHLHPKQQSIVVDAMSRIGMRGAHLAPYSERMMTPEISAPAQPLYWRVRHKLHHARLKVASAFK